jgi:hypothetical protein
MDDHDTAADTVFRDITMLLAAGFLAVVLLLLPFINPPVVSTETSVPPGNVIVTADWPDGWSTDVDLWVRAPGEIPVGYSNKDGPTFNLLRDDLGSSNDTTESNREQAVGRGVPAGTYVVNLHLYGNTQRTLPVPVHIEIAVVKPDGNVVTIFSQGTDLTSRGQELTVARFRLTAQGDLVPGSMNTLDTPLRKKVR